MKNIHLIETNKPSRLCKDEFGKFYLTESMISKITFYKNQHIYITSDEEIKKGYAYSDRLKFLVKIKFTDFSLKDSDGDGQLTINSLNGKKYLATLFRKVILTTDDLLIKDGVQAIDDEFLQWFVNNPTCKLVDVNKICNNCGDTDCIHAICHSQIAKTKGNTYKIIISKEQPKQETLEVAAENHLQKWRLLNNIHLSNILHAERCKNDFIEGAKWAQERMYSEEEVKHIIPEALQSALVTIDLEQWFEQFKKK